jgi:hypothetical protein
MTGDRKVVLVVASNRAGQLRRFLREWHGRDGFPWDMTIVVQDGGGKRFDLLEFPAALLYDWGDIENHYGGVFPEWLSRRDSGIKCWGFLAAIRDHEADMVVVLDDDCLPSTLAVRRGRRSAVANRARLLPLGRYDFVDRHHDALYNACRWTTTVSGFVPRGLPYNLSARGNLPVVLNMGLWEGIPDRDAAHELTKRTAEEYCPWELEPSAYRQNRVMSPQQYWPLCGMNFAFDRSIAPLMYFPRMGEGVPYRRFDDIWAGVIIQRCLRHLGLAASVGGPVVQHTKASDPLDNLVREAPAIRVNEFFWRIVDNVAFTAEDDTPLKCMCHIGRRFSYNFACDFIPEEWRGRDGVDELYEYIARLGLWIADWVREFEVAGWR